MFRIRFAPFHNAEIQIIGIFFRKLAVVFLLQFLAAVGVGDDRVFHHVLRDGLHQRIIGNGLHKNCPVIVFGGRRGIHLQSKPASFLFQAVVNVFNGLKPRHLLIVYVMRLIIEHRQFIYVADHHAQINF